MTSRNPARPTRIMHTARISRFSAISMLLLAALLATGMKTAFSQAEPARRPDVPYVPTPQVIVDKMLDIAKVDKNDMVYDLGCGDGRIVITAAKERGARGVGIDLNPARISEAKNNAATAGVEDKVKFIVGDLFQSDFSEASVVTLYLLPEVNRALRPILWKQLRIGTRIVSHDFDMGPEWPPEKVERIGAKTIYYWTITSAQKRAMA